MEEVKACEAPCTCTDPNLPVSSAIIQLIKAVRQKPPSQTDYLKPDDNDLWTLKLESPFPHYWTFGSNKNVPIVNLTTSNEAKLAFASGRFAILYDYEYETMVTLEGHKNNIRCLSVDSSGRFMATCDAERGNKVIVWDLQQCSPVHVIYEFENTLGCENLWISPCARFVIALRQISRQQELHFYNWTSNFVDSKIIVKLDENLAPVKKLAFSSDNPEFFMLTTEREVVFFTYVQPVKMASPKIRIHNGDFEYDSAVGKFSDSTYLSGTHLCYSATETGHVRVWSDLEYYDGMCEEKEITNFKNEITYNHVTNSKITVIRAIDTYVVIGNDMGKIQFFTRTFILVHWFEHKELSYITSLSFNLHERNSTTERKPETERKRADTLFILGRLCRKKKRNVDNWQKVEDVCYVLPRNLDVEPETFSVRDCIVCSKTEQVAYVNFENRSIEYLLENFVSDVVALECHPLRDYLVLATTDGFLYLIDYVMNQEIVRRTLLPLNVTSEKSLTNKGTVKCIKYSSDGYTLACGLSNGHLVLLSPLLLDFKHIVKYTHRPIRMIRFSPDGTLLAACDTTNMYFVKITTKGPELIARQKTHGRVIMDILFFIKPSGEITCFSVGKDKNLIQYDLNKIMEEKKVVVKKAVRIEQRSDPMCLSLAPDYRKIIMGKSDYKLQMINVDELVYTDNRHSPLLKNPVTKLCMLNSSAESEYLFFVACNHIGLIKLPLEINPYKWISIHVSDNKVSQYAFSRDKTFLFTLSKNEGAVHMWRVMTGLLEVLATNVGDDEGFKYENVLGPDREFLLKEIKDYFVYANLIHQGLNFMEAHVSTNVPVCEVPDILRAMGCFMTNYEMECAIRKGQPREKFKLEERKIDFTELVEMYASGREFSCIDLKQIKKAFYRLCSMKNGTNAKKDERTERKTISRNDFVHILTSRGETMSTCEALHFLRTLVDPMNRSKAKVDLEKQKLADRNEEDRSVDFLFLPENISYDFFLRSILGVATPSSDVNEAWKKRQAEEKDEAELEQRKVDRQQAAEYTYRRRFMELGITKGTSLVKEEPCKDVEKKQKRPNRPRR